MNSGSLVLTGTNSFTGGISVSGGSLWFSSDASLGDPSNAIILSGGALASSATISTARPLPVGNSGGTLQVSAGGAVTYSGPLSGSGALTKNDKGLARLTASEPFNGAVTVSGGTLALSGAGALSSVSSFTLNVGGTLLLDDSTASGGNTGVQRISTISTISGRGGVLEVLGPYSISGTESIGVLAIKSGSTTMDLSAGSSGSQTLSLVSLKRGGERHVRG